MVEVSREFESLKRRNKSELDSNLSRIVVAFLSRFISEEIIILLFPGFQKDGEIDFYKYKSLKRSISEDNPIENLNFLVPNLLTSGSKNNSIPYYFNQNLCITP